jgi:myo-inositol 2-dehydrogenase/D-chiro-inositol 1-dehydrogenase
MGTTVCMTVVASIIGAGKIARTHAEVLYDHEEVALNAVCDVRAERARALASAADAEAYTDYRTLFRESDPDVVYVATPPGTRVGIIREAARHGIAILCEKPLATTVANGQVIRDIVEEEDVPFMMGFPSRFAEPCRRMRELLADGDVGEPITVFSTRAGYGDPRDEDWRIDPEQACGVTIESTSHNIDMLRWLGGEIEAVSGLTANVTHPEIESFDDNTVATVEFERRAIGLLQNSWTSRVEYLRHGVIGTEGTVMAEGDEWWRLDRLTYATETDTYPRTITFDAETATEMGYAGQTDAFLESLSAGTSPPVTVYDGLRALEISHAIVAE